MISRTPGVAAYVQLADLLRAQIEAGVYGPGDRLPSLVDLSAAHGLSVVMVRQAISVLQSEGLVDVRGAGYGTRVASLEDEGDLTPVAVPRASRARMRPATAAERRELDLRPGVWILEVRTGARTKIYAGDRSLFTFS